MRNSCVRDTALRKGVAKEHNKWGFNQIAHGCETASVSFSSAFLWVREKLSVSKFREERQGVITVCYWGSFVRWEWASGTGCIHSCSEEQQRLPARMPKNWRKSFLFSSYLSVAAASAEVSQSTQAWATGARKWSGTSLGRWNQFLCPVRVWKLFLHIWLWK